MRKGKADSGIDVRAESRYTIKGGGSPRCQGL